VFYGTSLRDAASISIYFFVGSLLSLLKYKKFFRLDIAFILISASLICQMLSPKLLPYTLFVSLPYLVVSFGILETPLIRRFGKFGDPSYGIYLWGFPVQQIMISRFGLLHLRENILCVVTISVLIGYSSWHIVEKPFLSLKDKNLFGFARRVS
jgi:peptidoglycan/LPS O-acetylase OafA/YrhL